MRVEPNGKWEWYVTCVPIGSNDPDEQILGTVFADDMTQAVRDASYPDGYEMVMITRGASTEGKGFDLPDDHPLVLAAKHSIN